MAGIADILAEAALGGGTGLGVSSADPFGVNAFQSQVSGDDIYRTIGSQLLGSSSLFSNPLSVAQGIDYGGGKLSPIVSYHPMQSALGGLVTSLLGGLSTEYGKADEAKQMTSVASILPSLLANPNGAVAPEGVDEEAFSKLKANAEVNKAVRAAAMSDAVQKEYALNPMKALIAQQMGLRVPGGADNTVAANPAAAAANIGPVADGSAYAAELSGGAPKINQKSVDYLLQANGDPTLARQLQREDAAKQISGKVAQNQLATIGQSLAALKQIEDLKGRANKALDWGVGDWGSGTLSALASSSSKGSAAGIYDQSTVAAIDSINRALTGVGRGSIQQYKDLKAGAQTAVGKGPEAIGEILSAAQQDILMGAQEKLSALAAGGNTGALQLLQQVQGIDLGNPSTFMGVAGGSSGGDSQPQPTGEVTKSGKKVYIVNGVKGVID
jgi:hypothetical protein